ncbi:MAG: hypothetical protein Q8K72_03660, partial [Acidimicrobiales bacterium]|nr:hypothetical protein [Acidimicrobiales bacterium]
TDHGSDFGPIALPGRPTRSEPRALRPPAGLDPFPDVVGPAIPAPGPDPASGPTAVPDPPVARDAQGAGPDPTPDSEAESGTRQAKAFAVFARLHDVTDAPTEDEVPGTAGRVEPSAADVAPVLGADDEAFRRRGEALEPIQAEFLKLLKRTLADEQNEVLDALRRHHPTGVDDLLASAAEHQGRWMAVATASLDAAASAGAAVTSGHPSGTTDLAAELAATLVAPLRERIDRSFEAADGDLDGVADRVRALYREWKIQRLPEIGPRFVVAAYAHGLFDGTNKGAKVRWVVDPTRDPCPDCDDNVLAGVVVKGETFPTGNDHAPAHPGCHCLVLVHEDVLLTE